MLQRGETTELGPFSDTLPEEWRAPRKLSFTGVLLWIKGDWAEHSKTLGLSNWASTSAPCTVCFSSRDELHTLYNRINVERTPWMDRTHEDFFAACRKCETHVRVLSETMRTLIMNTGKLHFANVKQGPSGYILGADVPVLGLRSGDRLEPSVHLPDVHAFRTAKLPLDIIFWRGNYINTSLTDSVRHHCPLFDEELATSPARTLALDNLHTLHLGPMGRYCWGSCLSAWSGMACLMLSKQSSILCSVLLHSLTKVRMSAAS